MRVHVTYCVLVWGHPVTVVPRRTVSNKLSVKVDPQSVSVYSAVHQLSYIYLVHLYQKV